MDNISERIALVINHSGLTKTAFGKRLNVSQQHISNLALGKTAPSDRTISDICREFGVNEIWLRTGEGEPLARLDRDEEIAAWVGKVLSGDNEFKKDFISVLSKLDENAWGVLANIAQLMVDQRTEHKKKSEP